MKHISTTALAKEKGIETNEMFKILTGKKWIYKKDDKWHLTKEGRMAGGDIRYNPNYGEFIVWPENLDHQKKIDPDKSYNSTKIGKHFSITNRKVNLYLSELGWIEKNQGGWKITKAGEQNGAIQMEALNGKPYVIWSESIINNKHLIREIKSLSVLDESDLNWEEDLNEIDQIDIEDDFRKKYPAKLRTPDGHYVRSRAELLIDDFLYKNGIVHAYERKLNIDEPMYCDFYIPSKKLYIEYWGMNEKEQYSARKKTKLGLYAKYNFNLIELDDKDIENLDERLEAKLRKFEIIVG